MDSNHMNHAFEKYLNIFRAELPLDECFDLLERKLCIGGRRAVMYFIDGLHDGQKGQLLLNYLLAVQPETMQGLHESKDFLEAAVPFMDASVIEPQTDAPPKQHPMQYAEKGKLEEETLQRKQAHRKGKKAQGAEETEASDVVCAQEGTEVSQDEKRHMEAARMEALTADAAYDCYLQTLPKLYAGLVPLLVEGLDKIIEGRLDRKSIGFDAVIEGRKEKDHAKILREVQPHDILKFGIIPELVGRLPVIAALDELRRDDLVRILTEPKNALVKQYQKLLSYDGAELVFDHDALEEIADKAIERKIGARGLRAVMEGLLTKVMYDIPSDRTIDRVTITRDCVDGKEPPQLGHRKEALQEGKPAAELPPVEPAS